MGNVILHGHAPYGYKGVEREDRNFLEIEESQAEIVSLSFNGIPLAMATINQ
jgi:hypothetical protein